MRIFIKPIYLIMLFIVSALVNITVAAQELLLDQQIKAGELKLYPIYGKPKEYYYIPDKIIVPKGPNGKKQFSFLKFSNDGFGDVKKGAQGERTLDGGGLVSFLVSFKVEEDTVRDAESDLQAKVPGAKIMGPASFKEGNFTLVSNFKQEDGDWATKVLGIGKAPVMEGHKAAVSMRLTKMGSIILWESFHQAASDISVSFEMTLSGYHNPYEADIVAYWDIVAKNRSLNIGSKSAYLGVDIQKIMKSLRDERAIKVITKGEDQKMDIMWKSAYDIISKQIFDKTMDPQTLATLQDESDPFANFEKANKFNSKERARVKLDNKAEMAREETERARSNNFIDGKNSSIKRAKAAEAVVAGEIAEAAIKSAEESVEGAREAVTEAEEAVTEAEEAVTEAEEAVTEAQEASAKTAAKTVVAAKEKVVAKASAKAKAAESALEVAESDLEAAKAENDGDADDTDDTDDTDDANESEVASTGKEENKSDNKSNSDKLTDGAVGVMDALSSKIAPSFNKAKLQKPPGFALLASYRKKEFKKSGEFKYSLRKWTKGSEIINFDENIGGFGKKMINDPDHFRVISLDDAAFKNRLILIKLESQDAEDFKNFVNFVSVKIRKTHQDGTKTNREYVITKESFNKNPGDFSIIYGYHGDKDLDQWKQYEYQTSWNLFGGAIRTSDWLPSSNNLIILTPEHRYKEVTVEANLDDFAEGNVRVATVKFKYNLFGKQFSREVSMKVGKKEPPTRTIQYAHEANAESDYTYQVNWLKKGNIRIEEQLQEASNPLIYLEVPNDE